LPVHPAVAVKEFPRVVDILRQVFVRAANQDCAALL
jgi:Iap family predicted aminopeptidase